jgi:hypothetical protein
MPGITNQDLMRAIRLYKYAVQLEAEGGKLHALKKCGDIYEVSF